MEGTDLLEIAGADNDMEIPVQLEGESGDPSESGQAKRREDKVFS